MRRAKCEGVLNIQPLVIRSSLHSSSSLEYVKMKVYNEKMQFAQRIIHDIDVTHTSVVDFLCKSRKCWHAKVERTKSYISKFDVH